MADVNGFDARIAAHGQPGTKGRPRLTDSRASEPMTAVCLDPVMRIVARTYEQERNEV